MGVGAANHQGETFRVRVPYLTRLPLGVLLTVFDALPKVWDLI